jgi:hypothetical protein
MVADSMVYMHALIVCNSYDQPDQYHTAYSGRARQSKQELMDMLWDAGTCDKFFQSYYKWREPLCEGADPALLTLWGAYFVAALASEYVFAYCTTMCIYMHITQVLMHIYTLVSERHDITFCMYVCIHTHARACHILMCIVCTHHHQNCIVCTHHHKNKMAINMQWHN